MNSGETREGERGQDDDNGGEKSLEEEGSANGAEARAAKEGESKSGAGAAQVGGLLRVEWSH